MSVPTGEGYLGIFASRQPKSFIGVPQGKRITHRQIDIEDLGTQRHTLGLISKIIDFLLRIYTTRERRITAS